MDVIRELIRPMLLMFQSENSRFIFCQSAELHILVLQLQICQLHLVNDFFADLRVDWNVLEARLICDLRCIVEASRRKSLHVGIDDDEFTLKPLCDVLI